MGIRKNKKADILDMVITTPESNIVMTIEDYHKIMYPHATDAGYVGIATKKNGVWAQRMHLVTDWFNHVELSTNCYLSINTFYKPLRQIRSVRHLNAFFVDVDIYNAGVSQEDVYDAIDFYVRTERMLPPTMIISSGRGLYIIIKIEDVPGAYKKVRTLYDAIQQYLNELFADLGADSNAKDIARVLRVPGSTNTKASKNVEVLHYNPDAIYTMSMWAPFVDPFELQLSHNKSKKNKNSKKNITYLKNIYTLYKARASDILTLCYLRDYNVTGMRDTIIYIYHYFMMHIHRNEDVAMYNTLNLNDLFTMPLPQKEVKSYVKSSVRAYYDKQEDETKGYNFKNTTLIDKLGITSTEMKSMTTLINKRTKYDRNNNRRQIERRNNEGLTSRQAKKQENYTKIVDMYLAGYKQIDIAHKVGVSKGLVSQTIKKYKETT